MKKYLLVFMILGTLACQEKNKTSSDSITVHCTNLLSQARSNEMISIDIGKYPLLAKKSLNQIKVKDNNKPVVFQLVDIDHDGIDDKLIFQLDFKPNQEKEIVISLQEKPYADHKFPQSVNIRFGTKKAPFDEVDSADRVLANTEKKASDLYAMEGPAWENDKVAFRNYYDQRNGIDIFGKRTSDMVLDRVGIEGTNYHKLEPWGMDILKVGNSLGAGAIALMYEDTIYRIDNWSKSSYKLISDGPLKASLQLSFNDVKIRDLTLNVLHDITIEKGSYYYESKVSVTGGNDKLSFVTGIVNLHSDSLKTATSKNSSTYWTYDTQAEDGANLGMGIVVPSVYNVGATEQPTKGIGSTYLVNLRFENKTVKYRFYAGWATGSSDLKNEGDFKNMILSDAKCFSNPIESSL